jgi:uncharacterized membrane protein
VEYFSYAPYNDVKNNCKGGIFLPTDLFWGFVHGLSTLFFSHGQNRKTIVDKIKHKKAKKSVGSLNLYFIDKIKP